MNMSREDYEAAVKKTAFNVWEWGHAHTFAAGLIIGGVIGFVVKWAKWIF